MKFNLRSYLLGVASTVSVVALTSGVLAAGTQKNITAVFGATKYVLNGKMLEQESLLYNGTAYLPASYLARELGLTAIWDPATNITTLTSNIGGGEAFQGDQSNSFSRTNPAPINTAQKITIDNILNKYTASVKVLETLRGAPAYALIKEANRYNDDPPEGFEYILAKIAITIHSVSDDSAVSISEYRFDCFSSNNVQYDSPYVVEPQPQLASKLFAGGSTEGYVAFLVRTDDKAPKIAYELSYDGSGGGWFALQ